MVRMSNILRKKRETAWELQAKSRLERTRQEQSPESVKSKAYVVISPDLEDQSQEEAEISEVRISPIVMKEARVASNKEGLINI